MARSNKVMALREAPRIAPKRKGKASAANASAGWRVNWLLLIGTFVVLALVSPIAYGWHAYQFNRNSAMFLTRADDLEKAQKWSEAMEYLSRYRRAFPDDVDVRIRLAEVFDHIADKAPEKIPTSERLYAIAVGLAPDKPTLRLKHAERLLQLGQYRTALDEANELLRLDAKNRHALRIIALAGYGEAKAHGDMSDAEAIAKSFEVAIKEFNGEPEHVDLAIQLSEIIRRDLTSPKIAERVAMADKVMDDMVAANESRSAAWIGRYLYRLRHKQPDADADLDRALELDGEHTDALIQLAAAERARVRKDIGAATAYYEQLIAAHPKDVRGYAGLAPHLAAAGDLDAACDVLQRGLKNVAPREQLGLEMTLAELNLARGKLDAADSLIRSANKRIDEIAARNPGPTANRLRNELDVLRAHWHMQQQQYPAAIALYRQALLSEAPAETGQSAANRSRTYMRLGSCYAELRRWDQAGDAYKEAVRLQPKRIEPRLAMAEAYQSSGRIDDAIREFRQATAMPDATPDAWTGLIIAQIRQQLTTSDSTRNWEQVEQSLTAARQAFPAEDKLNKLSEQLDDIRTGAHKTLEVLAQAQAAEPTSRVLAERLIFAYDSGKQPEKADEVVSRFATSSQDKIDILVLKAGLLAQRNEFADAEKLLAEAVSEAPTERKSELEFRLATISMRRGRLDEARKHLLAVAGAGKTDELLLELLADVALQTKDLDDLAHWEAELEQQEGPDGTAWRFYRAQRLLAHSTGVADPRLSEVEQLVATIQRLRPRWPTGFLLQAQAAQAMQQPLVAIDAYRRALSLGEKRSFAQEQLILLLYATGQMEEVEKALSSLGSETELPPRLANISIALRIQSGDSSRAIQLAQREVERRPTDPMSYMALGQTLVSAKQYSQAESAFRKGTQVKPEDARPWQALFGYYLGKKDSEAARRTIDEMCQAVKLEPQELLPIVGKEQELMGDASAAETTYRKLLEASPKNPAALQQVAQFFFDRDAALAEQCLRRAIDVDPKHEASRLNLASFLITKGSPEQIEAAAKVLNMNSSASSPAEQGLQAHLLLKRGALDDRKRGQKLLEDLAAKDQASEADRLTLITLYEAEGRLRQSEEQGLALANRKNARPEQLARYVDLLLTHKRSSEAKPWLEKLVKAAPDTWATVGLQARMMAAESQTGGIEALIEAQLEKSRNAAAAERTNLLMAAATLYADLHLDEQAERAFRRLAEESPEGYRPLSNWLATHDRATEAVEICLKLAETDSTPKSASALARAMVVAGPDVSLADKAEPILMAAEAKFSRDPELLFALATWRFVQGQTSDAEKLFRAVAILQPKNSMVKNNLAMLLAEQPEKREEALALLDQAIATSGPMAELLDSKGMVILMQDKPQEAVELFDRAVTRPNPDPRHYFHLALALHKVNKRVEARQALRKAKESALSSAILSPKERQLLSQLERDLQS